MMIKAPQTDDVYPTAQRAARVRFIAILATRHGKAAGGGRENFDLEERSSQLSLQVGGLALGPS